MIQVELLSIIQVQYIKLQSSPKTALFYVPMKVSKINALVYNISIYRHPCYTTACCGEQWCYTRVWLYIK